MDTTKEGFVKIEHQRIDRNICAVSRLSAVFQRKESWVENTVMMVQSHRAE